jgi:DUF971 family protein/molybdopterin converting factor small subunit
MTEESTGPIPSEIKLHQRTRTLELTFGDGSHFMLPAEYLRVYSPAADNKMAMEHGEMVTGKERVAITKMTPVGNYAVRLTFDDGHIGGVYSWETLYELGQYQAERWQAYLGWLQSKGRERKAEDGPHLKLLYFVKLVERLGRDAEELDVPASVTQVGELLAWLRRRGGNWQTFLKDQDVQVTVNRKFASLDTPLASGDEVAIVPSHPR